MLKPKLGGLGRVKKNNRGLQAMTQDANAGTTSCETPDPMVSDQAYYHVPHDPKSDNEV